MKNFTSGQQKGLEALLNIDYPYSINPLSEEEGSGWVVEFLDLKGIIGTGDTIEEALEDAMQAKNGWLELCHEEGSKIPEPWSHLEDFNGKFQLRMPKSLHKWVIETAEKEGVSANQYITHILSIAKGHKNI